LEKESRVQKKADYRANYSSIAEGDATPGQTSGSSSEVFSIESSGSLGAAAGRLPRARADSRAGGPGARGLEAGGASKTLAEIRSVKNDSA
jgi:hypothetical protein